MLITQSPFAQYTDVDGLPLSGGSLYFGQVGQNPRTAPVAIFWDAAGTQPAAQPVKTLGGYPVRNGSPANVYTSGAYSVALYNPAGELVFYAPDSAAFDVVLGATTTFTRSLLDDPDAATARTTLGAAASGANSDITALGTVTMTGPLTLSGNASTALQAVPKQQLDASVANRMQYSLTASQATTSGVAKDFTSVPSWAKRITVVFDLVSTNGSDQVCVSLGTSGGIEKTGYQGSSCFIGTSGGVASTIGSGGATIPLTGAAATRSGRIVLQNFGGNVWEFSGQIGDTSAGNVCLVSGRKSLASALTQLSVTTINGTDAFDGGAVSLLIEG